MEARKDNNRATYLEKNFHQRQEKVRRVKESEGQYACFASMTAEALENFMNYKYENCLGKSSDSIVKINQAIIDRLNALRCNFESKRKKQFKQFVSRGGRDLTDEEYDFTIKHTYNYMPKYGRTIRIPYKNIQMAKVLIHENDTNMKETKMFYLGKLPQDCTIEFKYRKLHKDALAFLKEFISLKQTIEECLKQQ